MLARPYSFLRLTSVLSLVLALCLLCCTPQFVTAAFPIADRTDAEVQELVSSLKGFADDYESDGTTGIVHLERTTLLDATRESHRIATNRVLHALDRTDEERATQTYAFESGQRVISVGGWIVRASGSLERLNERDVRVSGGKDGASGEVVLAFPQLDEGDTFGWSVVIVAERPFFWDTFDLDTDTPVAYGRFIVKSDGYVAYSVRALNVRRGDFSMKVTEEKNGNPSMIVATFRSLPADRWEVWSPPSIQRRVRLVVNLKGEMSEDAGMWITTQSWNRLALYAEPIVLDLVEPHKVVKKHAESIVDGLSSENERIDALYHFVRDEITLLGGDESEEIRSARAVLESRVGTPIEKAGLLVALLRGVGAHARLGFTRDRFWGPLEHSDPGFWQFTEAVVAVGETLGADASWYAPAQLGCPPRVLPPHLRGVEVLFFADELRKKDQVIGNRVYGKVGGAPQQWVREYLEQVRRAPWVEIVTTPGDAHAVVGVIDEIRLLDLDAAEESVQLTAQGMTMIGDWARSGESGGDCAQRYVEARGLTSEGLEEPQLTLSDDRLTARLQWRAPVAVPMRAPDAWILPAELLFGRSVFSFWTGPDRGPIFIASAYRQQMRTEVAIPEGWVLAESLPAVEVANPLFEYQGRVYVRDAMLVVERTLSLRAGQLGTESMTLLDDDIRAILGFESLTMAVHPAAAAGGGDGVEGRR